VDTLTIKLQCGRYAWVVGEHSVILTSHR